MQRAYNSVSNCAGTGSQTWWLTGDNRMSVPLILSSPDVHSFIHPCSPLEHSRLAGTQMFLRPLLPLLKHTLACLKSGLLTCSAITGGDQCLQSSGTDAITQNCGPGITGQAWTPTFLFDENDSTSASGFSSASASGTSATGAAGVIGGAAGSATSTFTPPALPSRMERRYAI